MPVVELPAAVLLCDPEGGAPETFYSVQGSLGGKLLICHCSSGRNNVVVTEFAASGFTVLGRPSIYTP